MRGIWKVRLSELGPARRSLVAGARILVASLHGLQANQGSLRAAGLTYLTLMALVPMLAVVFAIANGFAIESNLREALQQALRDYPKGFQDFLARALALVERIDFKALGLLGSLALVSLVLSVMGRVEQALNLTWKARRRRNLARRYADYLAFLLLIPGLVLLATGLNTAFQLEGRIASLEDSLPWLAWTLRSGLRFLPVLLLCSAATLLYKIVPNVQVRWPPALASGILTGFLWIGAQWVFLRFQIGLAQMNAIYGSLAFLPLLLFYLYSSWTIVLWGGELCFALQHLDQLTAPGSERPWTPARRRRYGYLLAREAMEAFARGQVLSLGVFAGRTGLPRDRVDDLVKTLSRAGVLRRVRFGDSVVPALPPGKLAVGKLFAALDGEDDAGGRGWSEEEEARLVRLKAAAAREEGFL